MVWLRVQRLPSESRRLLAVVSLWGQPLPLDRAMRISEVGQSAIGPLRSGHLIRTVGLAATPNIETYHDRVREVVAERLDGSAKQQHHLKIAEECARQSPLGGDAIRDRLGDFSQTDRTLARSFKNILEVDAAWYDIAFHFDAAERPDLAFPYACAAAEKARTQFSLEVADNNTGSLSAV